MTIIEFFDHEMLENIISAIHLNPERMILFGKENDELLRAKKNIDKVFQSKSMKTTVLTEVVDTNDYPSLCKALNSLIDKYPDAIFDLTGGEELILVAMGAVSQKHGIKMLSHDFENHVSKIIEGEKTLTKTTEKLIITPDEIISLYGGKIQYGDLESGKTYPHKITKDTEREILALWEIAKRNTNAWNVGIEALASYMAIPFCENKGLTFSLSDAFYSEKKGEQTSKKHSVALLLERLQSAGLIETVKKDIHPQYRFQNEFIKYALSKSGTALELYTLLCIQKAKNESGTKLTEHALSGAVIDWETYNYDPDDVKNEIDVFLTKGLTPVFISCKNGSVETSELYKLNTVSKRFGGVYSKKILIMSSYRVRQSFLNRANALNIKLIRNVQKMTQEEFIKQLEENIR